MGPDYPAQEVYDPAWVGAELSPFLERQTWVADLDGSLLASVSFLKPSETNLNPVANLGRVLFRAESLANGAAEELLAKIQALCATRGQMAVARVAVTDPAQQRLFERLGFTCVGFQPSKHRMPEPRGIIFYAHFARPVLVNRLPFSESLPQVSALGNFILDHLQLPGFITVADGATGYPLLPEVRLEEVSYEDFEVWRRQAGSLRRPDEISCSHNLGFGLLRVPAAAPPLALLAQGHRGVVAGLAFLFDPHDRCLRFNEAFTTDDLSLGALMRHALKLAQEKFFASYVEMDALMTAPRLLKTAEQLGFVPVAYLPAFVSHKGAFLDVVKMVKLNVAYGVESSDLAPGAAAVVEMASRYFEDQKVGVAVINLLRGLPLFDGLGDGELRKVARLFEQKLYRPGETVFQRADAGTEVFVVMRGQVDLVLEEAARPLASVSGGQVFGEQAFLDGSPRTASAVAIQPSILLVVQRQVFHDLTQHEPHLGMVIMRNLAAELSGKLRRVTAGMHVAQK